MAEHAARASVITTKGRSAISASQQGTRFCRGQCGMPQSGVTLGISWCRAWAGTSSESGRLLNRAQLEGDLVGRKLETWEGRNGVAQGFLCLVGDDESFD